MRMLCLHQNQIYSAGIQYPACQAVSVSTILPINKDSSYYLSWYTVLLQSVYLKTKQTNKITIQPLFYTYQ